jgi:hypothetical protein
MHKTEPRPVGRPKFKKGKAKSVLVQARVQPHEKANYERAMKASGSSDLSSWVRETLNRCVEPSKD